MRTSATKPFRRHDIPALKARIDLRDIAETLLGPAVKRRHKYSSFYAPNREERSPSLMVWRDGFKDFGSGDKGGDLFTFLERYAGLSFTDVLEQYDPDGGELIFDVRSAASPRQRPDATALAHQDDARFARWQTIAQRLVSESHANLKNDISVQTYLSNQGYTPETIDTRQLGYNPDWQKIRFDDDTLWLPPGIVYPWLVDGGVWAIKVRCPYERNNQPDALSQLMNLPPQKAKYMHVGGGRGSQAWYGTLDDNRLPVIFVEGEKDCDNLYQQLQGRCNVITVGSATGVLSDQLTERLAHAAWIAVVLDNDRAGRENTLRLKSLLEDALGDNGVLVVDHYIDIEHKDITDWLQAGGDAQLWWQSLDHKVWTTIANKLWRQDINTGVFPSGTPDILREMILGMHNLSPHGKRFIQDHANAAMVFDVIQHLLVRQQLASSFTLKSLKDAAVAHGIVLDDSSTRRGLAQLLALGFLSDSQPISLLLEDRGGNAAENSSKGRGRPAKQYYIVPLRLALPDFLAHMERRLREALYADVLPANVEPEWFVGLIDEATATELAMQLEQASAELYATYLAERQAVEQAIRTQLNGWRNQLKLTALQDASSTSIRYDQFAVTSGRDYRDALYGSMVMAADECRQVPRAETARALGVDYKTVGAMRKRLGIVADPDFETITVEAYTDDICATADSLAVWAAGREYGRYLESSNGEVIRLDPYQTVRATAWFKRQRMTGATVVLKIQVASIERFATEEELLSPIGEDDVVYPELPSEAQPPSHKTQSSVRASTNTAESVCVDVVNPAQYTRAFVAAQLELRRDYWCKVANHNALLNQLLQDVGLLHRCE